MLRGRLGAFLVYNPHAYRQSPDDGRPSYIGLTFLALDDSYGRIGDGSIFSSPSIVYLPCPYISNCLHRRAYKPLFVKKLKSMCILKESL